MLEKGTVAMAGEVVIVLMGLRDAHEGPCWFLFGLPG
jgi:hypothetical protein